MCARGLAKNVSDIENEEDDIRVLPVFLRRDGRRRHRRMEHCALLFEKICFDDWPLEGEMYLTHAVREITCAGRTWLTESQRAPRHRALHLLTTTSHSDPLT